MDQATQAAMARELECKSSEKRVVQMTESELIQLVMSACHSSLLKHDHMKKLEAEKLHSLITGPVGA